MLEDPVALALGLVVGLVLLTVSADRFVVGAARLAGIWRVSPVIVGAVVIGFGTSTPELLVSVLGALQDAPGLVFGNLVGSNTANVLLVLGAAALVAPIGTAVVTLRREVPMMLCAVLLLAALAADGHVTRVEGGLLVAAGVAALVVLVRIAVRDRVAQATLAAELGATTGAATPHVGNAWLLATGGLLGTLAGAQLLVVSAGELARSLGIAEAVIGLTVVAIGTSLPELVTALAAARRGEADLVLGNVLGSNLLNTLPVAGIAALIAPPQLDPAFPWALGTMVVACAVASGLLATGRRLSRVEGALLLAGFVAAMTLVALV